jgi:autotransporter-associated beta strand protein
MKTSTIPTSPRISGEIAHAGSPRGGLMAFASKAGLLPFAATLAIFAGSAQAQWLSNYTNRKPLPINAGVAAGTGYQIQVKVGESSGSAGFDIHLEGKSLGFPNDVRFSDNDGTTSLSHWLESTTGSAPNRTATFWVKVNDSLDSSQSIFTYYGKSGDTSGSSGDATFSFFDDFPGAAIDTAKWTIDNATGWSVTGGELRGTNTSGRIRSQAAFSSGVILETKYRSVSRPGNGNMALGFYTSASDSFGWLNHPGGDYMRVNSAWTAIGNENNVPVIASMAARATQVDFYVYRQDNGAVWHNRPNNNSTVSNERVTLGARYDNGGSFANQSYNAFWDWIRIRKLATSVPTLGAAGAEQANAPALTLVSPANGSQVVTGFPASATATVTGGTPPYAVTFFRTFNGGAPVSAGTVSASPYTINLGVLANGNYTIQAQVADSSSPTPATVTSATHSFTVAPDLTPPTPNPMTFAIQPVTVNESSISMTATTATDLVSPPVQYFFENSTNSTDSGWISSPTWVQGGLTLDESYNFRVKARDSASPPNETAFSGVFSASPGLPPTYSITLNNPGFENPILANGDSTSAVEGWGAVGDARALAWHPAANFYASGAPEGQNIGDVFQSPAFSGFSQFLQGSEGQFQAGNSYGLKVKVGRNLLDPYDGYVIQLLANGIVIVQDDNSLIPTAGSFVTASLNYTYNAALHAGLVGYPLEIRLLSKGLGGGSGDVNFDDVRMTYSTSNPLANHGGPYRLSQGNALTLNGSASIASPGATITSYEWDIDSRNDHLGFIADFTGATPATIPYGTLTGTYGMQPGENTIRFRITDNSGQSATGSTTVTIFSLLTYVGPANSRGQDERWNLTSSWNTGTVPSGLVDVVIPESKGAVPCLSSVTPKFTGNLSIGANSGISIGWTTAGPDAYNAMGTPGKTVITMESGSSLNFRIGGTPSVPAITLTGNASVTLGSSTNGGAQASFNHPITGNHRISIYGNSQTNCVANFNAPNTFSEIHSVGVPYADGGVTVAGNAAGSLGVGNLTFDALGGGGNSARLVINAANSMADTATLSMSGNSGVKITMNANDTIAKLVINGTQLPPGTYGSSTSSATFKQTWIGGNAILTVTEGEGSYWDINGATAGAGGTSPAGTWTSGSTFWSNSPAGSVATAPWVSGRNAVFSAGSDATGSYTVTVGDSNAITATNTFTAWNNTGSSNFSATKSWDLMGGNCVVVLVSSLNATNLNTATYNGLPMTVVPGVKDTRNSYVGIAYIIAGVNGAPNPLPATGNVVLGVNRVVPAINTGSYANMGTVYSILSLSNVASAGTEVSQFQASGNPPATRNITYSTSVNNGFVVGIASDSEWRKGVKTVVGTANQVLFSSNTAQPAYFNTLHCVGPVNAAASYTDVYGSSITALITLPFNALATPNPLLPGSGQKISGLTFEKGAVTLSGSKLELQIDGSFTSLPGVTGTIASQLTGLSTSGIVKKGPGTVVLSNSANSYAGTTKVQNGILLLAASNALPNTSVILAGDAPGVTATLDLNGFNNTLGGLSFGGSAPNSGSLLTTGAGTLTLGGNVSFSGENSPLGAVVSGKLSLGSSTRTFHIDDSLSVADDLTVSAVVSGTGGLAKSGFGTLLLTGNNTYTGPTSVNAGLLALSGANNSAATGGITVNNGGAIRFDSLGSINGTGQNVTIQQGGLAAFGASFGAGNIPTAMARMNPASAGVVAVDNYRTTPFDFAANGLNVFLGALTDVTYTGVISPNAGTYRIGGGTGALTLSATNTLTGGGTLLVGGKVIIANSNSFSGATTIQSTGRLEIGRGGTSGSIGFGTLTNNGTLAFNRSDTLTQGANFWSVISGTGIVEKSGSGTLVLNAANSYSGGTTLFAGTMRLGHSNALGSGSLSIYSGALDVSGDMTLATNNAVTVAGDFGFGGTGNLNMGNGSVSTLGNPVITLGGSNKTLTFGGVMTNVTGGDQSITVDGAGNTLVLGGVNFSANPDSFLVGFSVGGSANVSITGTINDGSLDQFDIRLGSLTKTGTGTLTLSGINNYTGATVVGAGVLHLLNSNVPSQVSPITVNSGATLAFTLGTSISSTKRLTLNDGHKIRIIGTPDPLVSSYALMTASSIVGGSPTLETPIPGYFLEIAGNVLQLSKADVTAPELVEITNDQGSGPTVGPILPNTLITYTVAFNEDIDQDTVTATDFRNAGTSAITIGTIFEVSPGVFTVQVTPTTVGTVELEIPTSAVIKDLANNVLVTDPALLDDTTINVALPANDWLLPADIQADIQGVPITVGTLVTYSLFFNRDIDHATVTAADFANAGTAAITIGSISEIEPGTFTVQVTPTALGTLRLSIPTTADIRDPSNNRLDNDPAILDDDSLEVVNAFYVWAGEGNEFSGDLNGDGISNGLAWLLGASAPGVDARNLLPVADEQNGDLILVFVTLESAVRGTASIDVQYSNDLGINDTWIDNTAEVPGSPGISVVNGIRYDVQSLGNGFLDVQATIPAAAAGTAKKLFGRVIATAPLPPN